MISASLIAIVFIIVGTIVGIGNKEYTGSTFWFWLALLLAVVLSGYKLL